MQFDFAIAVVYPFYLIVPDKLNNSLPRNSTVKDELDLGIWGVCSYYDCVMETVSNPENLLLSKEQFG